MAIKKEIGIWQVVAYFGRDFQFMQLGWRKAEVGIIRITSFPPEGVAFSKENYNGFILSWRYFLPWEKA
jgi:hypothetical protein